MSKVFRLSSVSLSRQAAIALLALGPWVSVSAQTPATPVPSSVSAATAVGQPADVGALSSVPAPALTATAWLSMDLNSDQTIASLNADERIEPASLTKLMAAYVIFDALQSGRLSLEQKVHVSEKAWKTEGSRMFIKPNTQVEVGELLQGFIVQSGNDATIALAEAVAGSENAFVALMNEEAARQGLKNTYFVNAPGLPHAEHLTTVSDLAILAKNLIDRFPQYMHYYSQKEYTYNGIKQSNRNRLLWTDPTVDGLKTGHTSSAGYCLVSTAVRDGRRILVVVVGTASDAARTENSLKLLNWSFQNFDTVKLFDADKPAVTARVWEGTAETVGLGSLKPTWVTVPRGKGVDVTPVANYTQPLLAPLSKGQDVGTVTVSLDGQVLREEPLQVLADVPQGSFFNRMYDKVMLLFQ